MTDDRTLTDPTQPVQTRGGKAARILSTDGRTNGGQIVAEVEIEPCVWVIRTFLANGRFLKNHPLDLVNVAEAPKPLTRDELHDFFRDAISGRMNWATPSAATAIMREIDELGATDAICAALAKWGAK